MAQRDPTVVMWWLAHRLDPAAAPQRQIVLDLAIFGQDAQHPWLLIARDTGPTLCMEDPMLDRDRYVSVEADAAHLSPIARGLRDWTAAIADGSVHLYGEPALVRDLPNWFLRAGAVAPVAAAAVPVAASGPAGGVA